MEHDRNIDIGQFIRILWRRKWYVILPFVALMSASIVVAVALPDVYEASSTIQVDPQTVPPDYVPPTVTTNLLERMDMIAKQIMSYTELIKLIEKYQLYREEGEEMTGEQAVNLMRENITFEPVETITGGGPAGGRPGRPDEITTDTVRITFRGERPKIVANVANDIASLFREESLQRRADQASSTSDFLTERFREAEERLLAMDQEILRYRQENGGALPEELEPNLRSLDRMSNALLLVDQRLAQMRDMKRSLEMSIAELSTTVANPRIRLEDARLELGILQSEGKTARHPDIISKSREIDALKKRLREGAEEEIELSTAPLQRELIRAKQELANAEGQVGSLQAQAERLRKDIEKAQERVDRTPKVMQQLEILTRRRADLEVYYSSLQEKSLGADLARELELRQQGENFRILERALVPTEPVSPNRPVIVLVGFMLSLGFGGLAGVIAEFSDRSFRTRQEMQDYFELPVIAAIPNAVVFDTSLTGALRRNRAAIVASSLFILIALMLVAYFVFGDRLPVDLPGILSRTASGGG